MNPLFTLFDTCSQTYESTYVIMLHFTEDFDFSERSDAGEQGLKDTGDLLQRCPATSARVHHRPKHTNMLENKYSNISDLFNREILFYLVGKPWLNPGLLKVTPISL